MQSWYPRAITSFLHQAECLFLFLARLETPTSALPNTLRHNVTPSTCCSLITSVLADPFPPPGTVRVNILDAKTSRYTVKLKFVHISDPHGIKLLTELCQHRKRKFSSNCGDIVPPVGRTTARQSQTFPNPRNALHIAICPNWESNGRLHARRIDSADCNNLAMEISQLIKILSKQRACMGRQHPHHEALAAKHCTRSCKKEASPRSVTINSQCFFSANLHFLATVHSRERALTLHWIRKPSEDDRQTKNTLIQHHDTHSSPMLIARSPNENIDTPFVLLILCNSDYQVFPFFPFQQCSATCDAVAW